MKMPRNILNRIKISIQCPSNQLDEIQEAVEDVVGHFDFDDTDNYQPEFELDYDSKVFLSSIESLAK